jgi:hypothetical protein
MALKSTEITYRPVGVMAATSGALNKTLGYSVQIEPNTYTKARLLFMNAALYDVVNVEASISFAVDASAPLVPASTPTTIQVGGLSQFTLPENPHGDVERVGYTLSDQIDITPDTRADGGRGYIAHIRVYQPLAGNTEGTKAADARQLSGDFNQQLGRMIGFFQTTNQTSTVVPLVQSIEGANAILILEAENGAITLAGVGDSITAGWDGVTDLVGAGRYTCNDLSLAGIETAWYNNGLSGHKTEEYYLDFVDSLNYTTPSVSLFSPWSPNNTNRYDEIALADALSYTNQFVSLCRAEGIVPKVATPTPIDGILQVQEDGRVAIVNAIKAEVALLSTASQPVYVLDRNEVHTDPASPTGGFISGHSDDGLHTNATGSQVESIILTGIMGVIAGADKMRSIKIDLGIEADETPPPWNNIITKEAGIKIPDAIDDQLAFTGVQFEFDTDWNGVFDFGVNAEVLDWPSSVTKGAANGVVPERLIATFPPEFYGVEIDWVIWGGQAGIQPSPGTRLGRYTLRNAGEDTLATGTQDAWNNGGGNVPASYAPPLTLQVTIPDDGILNLDCEKADGSQTAFYLSGLELDYTLPTGPPKLTTSYSNITVTLQDILAFDVTTVWSGATSYTINGMTYALEDVNNVITGMVVDSGTRNFNIEAHNESGTNTDSFYLQVLSGIPNKVRG